MKNLLFLILLCCIKLTFGQKPIEPIAYSWEQLEQLTNDGLYKDALKMMNPLLEKSILEKNLSDFQKSFLKYTDLVGNSMLESDEKLDILAYLEKTIDKTDLPLNNLGHLFLAQLYTHYPYQWELINEFKIKIGTSTLTSRNQAIRYHNNLVLNQLSKLIHYPAKVLYLSKNDSTLHLFKPTLLDFCLNEIKNNFQEKTQYQDTSLFGTTENLKQYEHDTILSYYYQLEKFHSKNQNDYAYVETVFDRLAYCNSKYAENKLNKDIAKTNYNWLLEKVKTSPAALAVLLKQGAILDKQGETYAWRKNTGVKQKKEEAVKLIEQGCIRYPKSVYSQAAHEFLALIKNTSLEVKIEGNTLLNENNLISLKYKNLDSAYLSIYHIEKYTKNTSSNFLKNHSLKKVHHENLRLGKNGLYNLHTNDFVLPKWKQTGDFLVIVTKNAQSTETILNNDTLNPTISFSYLNIKVHDFTVRYKTEKGNGIIQVVDLKKGLPIANAKINLKEGGINQKNKSYTTQKNGEVLFPINDGYIYWTAIHNSDSVSNYMYANYPQNSIEPIHYTVITDRSIYRPGQTVFYKIFAYQGVSPTHMAVSKSPVLLSLRDQIGKILAESSDNKLAGETNEFGTYTGSITLSKNGYALGNISIEVNNKTLETIHVAEYKRPTFKIETQFNKKEYTHGDTVSIQGNVISYAGVPITNAKIELHISSYLYYKGQDQSTFVKLDTTLMTDKAGLYNYSFPTQKSTGYGTNYAFESNITSENGETQSHVSEVFVGLKKQEWNVSIPSEVFTDENITIDFNLVEKQKNEMPFKLIVLKQNKKREKIKAEYNENEFKSFTKKEFEKLFPTSYYFENTKISSDYDTVFTATKQLGERIPISAITKGIAGNYKFIYLFINEHKDTIQGSTNSICIHKSSAKKQHNDELWLKTLNPEPEIGENVQVLIGTNFTNQFIHYRLYRDDALIERKSITISKRTLITHRVSKEDLRGLRLEVTLLKDAKQWTEMTFIPISQKSKEVKLHLETKLDYVSPGQKEKWIISSESTIKSEKELVVSMMDASLDQFQASTWKFDLFHNTSFTPNWAYLYFNEYGNFFETVMSWDKDYFYISPAGETITISPQNILFKSSFKSLSMRGNQQQPLYSMMVADKSENTVILEDNKEQVITASSITVPKTRTNFNETAFFYPNVYADKDGKFSFEFTLPDALTTWKLRALAHDKEMNFGQLTTYFIAQKELMVQPNAPRFFRAGDVIEFSALVSNITDKNVPTAVSLEWFNPFTNELLTPMFGKIETQKLNLNGKQSKIVSWKLNIPENEIDLIAYRIKASSELFTDSEEKALPILSNRVFVNESLPITIEEKGTFSFELAKLSKVTSATQEHQHLVFDFSSNPIWTAVKALPYASKLNYYSSDALFNAYYVTFLGSKIVNTNPEIKKMIGNWNVNTSELTANPMLKSVDLNETPWVTAAKNETEQRKEIALFLNENTLANNQKSVLDQLFQQRNQDGAWPWFASGKSSVFITNNIVFGFAQLNEKPIELASSIAFLNTFYLNEFNKRNSNEMLSNTEISEEQIQWLFIQESYQIPKNDFTSHLINNLSASWKKLNLKQQAIAGMYLLKAGNNTLALKIAASIENRATKRKNTGTYWNEKYHSTSAAIETQAYILQFFKLLNIDALKLASIQLSLLNQKRGQLWENNSTTATVVHAMLSIPNINLSGKITSSINIASSPLKKEANELGDITQVWSKKEITPALGKVEITQKEDKVSFGSLSYAYVENIEKIKNNITGLNIEKEIYLIQGEKEILITPTTKIHMGDLLRIQIKVNSDRNLEYVHIKDLKAAGMENVNQLSTYGYGKNVSYYSTPYDNRTSFFIEYLPKGKSSVSYDVRITHKGLQSIGYALVECLYAPEFRGNTSGREIVVE